MKNSFNILLQSQNIDYVELSKELIDDYLEMANNSNINKLIHGKEKFYSYEDEINWINNKLEEKAIIFSMIERMTGKFIGNVEFMHVTEADAEIGISITEDYQNKHYGTETLKTMIDFGFNRLGLEEINLIVFSHNLRAIHCYKKLGFIEYKVVENVRIVDGEPVNDIYIKLKK